MGTEVKQKWFMVAMCLQNQPRWRRLQTNNTDQFSIRIISPLYCLVGTVR